MTNSSESSKRLRSGSRTAEPVRPAGSRAAGRVVQSPAWSHLSRGMGIRAVIEARLLGKRLLTLDADITILPATGDRTVIPVPTGQATRKARQGTNGHLAGGLAEAARSLESGAATLKEARENSP